MPRKTPDQIKIETLTRLLKPFVDKATAGAIATGEAMLDVAAQLSSRGFVKMDYGILTASIEELTLLSEMLNKMGLPSSARAPSELAAKLDALIESTE